ncbi:MAG: TA system VapC family ribonuclease toxin [Acidobacteriota bacterium]
MFVVDTNVLFYATDHDSPFFKRCNGLLRGWRHGASAWCLTWGIVYEFMSILTHPRTLRAPRPTLEAWQIVSTLLASPSLGMLTATDRHAAVAAEVFREIPHLAGNLMHDAETAILMREHGIRRIYTRDTHFHRFPFLEVLDPVA